jgi:hypothetical protein
MVVDADTHIAESEAMWTYVSAQAGAGKNSR